MKMGKDVLVAALERNEISST